MRKSELRIAALCLAGLTLGCSGNPPSESGPSPRPSVVPSGGETVTTTGERSTAATLGIPPGHLPAPGECRVWEPGRPPGQQRRLPRGSCRAVERAIRPGQWLVYRPTTDKKVVEVRTYGATAGRSVVRLVRIFDVATGVLVRESGATP